MPQVRVRRENGQEGWSGFFKYLVPVSIAIIIVVIVARILLSGGTDTSGNKMGSYVTVTPKEQQSEIYIYMSGDSKQKIEAATKMYAVDSKMEVATGEAEVSFEGTGSRIYADKLAELKYEGNLGWKQSFTIINGCIWLEASALGTEFNLRNFNVIPSDNSVITLCQNAVSDTLYVLKWDAQIQSNAKTATVWVGQQLMLLNGDVTSPGSLNDKINPLEDFFKTSSLYIKHNGSSYLSSGSGSTLTLSGTLDGSGSSLSGSILVSGKKDIIITYPTDESTADQSSIDITGNIGDPRIVKVTFNEKDAAINVSERSFILKGFALNNEVNDIVYKTFDKDATLVSKGMVTVYLSKKVKKDEENKPTVTTYPLSDKDFRIVAPAENPYKTTDNVVRIEGRVNKGTVKYITINDFRLSKFVQLGTYWYYFANKDFGTMNDGINLYTIKYYGPNDELLFTNLFTIVKESKPEDTEIKPVTPTSATGSGQESAIN